MIFAFIYVVAIICGAVFVMNALFNDNFYPNLPVLPRLPTWVITSFKVCILIAMIAMTIFIFATYWP